MRLINTSTYELDDHINPGPYAILSHTWRDEEVLYADFVAKRCEKKKGTEKVRHLCEQARKDGITYAWIDTVCIDKSSSAELSEAINSMFMWYKEAKICYVYVDDTDDVSGIGQSRWISRGWTLQELIAPSDVRFYGRKWNFLGTKSSLVMDLVSWTRIDQIALVDSRSIMSVSVATRMSWASTRQTTRIEDLAYCLLGLFGVNMPLLYGERGASFARLQEEILRRTRDMSIFAFDRRKIDSQSRLFAQNPEAFNQERKIIMVNPHVELEVTSEGVRASLPLLHVKSDDKHGSDTHLAVLGHRFEFDLGDRLAIPLQLLTESGGIVPNFIPRLDCIRTVPREQVSPNSYRTIYIRKGRLADFNSINRSICRVRARSLIEHGFDVIYATPETALGSWNQSSLTSEMFCICDTVHLRKFGFRHSPSDEAFIVMFAVVPHNTKPHRVFISVKTKPQDLNCNSWLETEQMFGVVGQPRCDGKWASYISSFKSGSGKTITIDDIEWELVWVRRQTVPFQPRVYEKVSLMSNRSFSAVTLRVGYSPLDTENIWTILVEPEATRSGEKSSITTAERDAVQRSPSV